MISAQASFTTATDVSDASSLTVMTQISSQSFSHKKSVLKLVIRSSVPYVLFLTTGVFYNPVDFIDVDVDVDDGNEMAICDELVRMGTYSTCT